jgi:hypothetical protein
MRQSKSVSGSEYLNPGNPDILVQQFFRDFSQALTDGDIDAIKKCWAIPSYVVGNAMQMVVKSEDEVERFFSGTKEQYNRRGIMEAIPDIESIQWLTEKIALVGVRWPYYNRDGVEIGEESSCYTLKLMPEGDLKIVCTVMQGSSDEEETFTH